MEIEIEKKKEFAKVCAETWTLWPYLIMIKINQKISRGSYIALNFFFLTILEYT